jgi:c(7)-type cytochrome triheme protein
VRVIASVLLTAVFASLLVTSSLAVDGDVVLKRQEPGASPPPAVFPHWFHRIRFKCYACHPAIFEMKAGATAMTMDEIREGKFCGACHNGKIAWEMSFDTCNRCHVER